MKKKFCIFEKPSIGLKDVLVIPLVIPRSESDKEVHVAIYMVHIGHLLLFWLATSLTS